MHVFSQHRIMKLFTVFIVALVAIPLGECQKILVMPLTIGMNSRLFNLVKMADILVDNGYDVTIITNVATKPFIRTKAEVYEVRQFSL